MAKRYIVWTQLEVIDEDGEPETIKDSYVSVCDFGSLKEAQTLQRKLYDEYLWCSYAPDSE